MIFRFRYILLLLMGFMVGGSIFAQGSHKNYDISTDRQPSFPGGDTVMMEFFIKNIQFPEEAKQNDKDGKVFVSFDVLADGSTSDIRVLRNPGFGMGEEAKRVVGLMKFEPGQQGGRAVRMNLTLPVVFTLEK